MEDLEMCYPLKAEKGILLKPTELRLYHEPDSIKNKN